MSHPNVVKLFDFGVAFERPFIVEEECPEILGRFKAREPKQWLNIASGFLDALAALHDSGFIHNDLNHVNVTYDGVQIKLIDFGSCVTSKEAEHGIRYSCDPGHSAPELRRSIPYDQRTDIYSAASVLNCYLEDLEAGSFRDAVSVILSRAMNNDPQKRPSNANEMKSILLSL